MKMDDLSHAFAGEEDSCREEGYYHDPDGSKWQRREAWIEERMRGRGREDSCGRFYFELMYDLEYAPLVTEWELLQAKGLHFPPPETLDDAELSIKLDELLDELLRMHVEVHFEESDLERELYTSLVTRCLHEPRREVPLQEGSGWHIDLLRYDFDED